ncbi:MAG: DUF4491 family protein [Paludibacteraceae bacterium]|nr:DUF4491 family protein [Paludibacteraceae bacterium]
MSFLGIAIGLSSFVIIGILHPVVIKTEYYFGKKVWPIFAVLGTICLLVSLFVQSIFFSILLAVLGFSLYWSIFELFEQEKRVAKGWFPRNPKKK